MALATLLDKLESAYFADITFLNAKDVIKEISGISNDTVMTNEIKRLTPQQLDTLMKVVYVGLANDSRNSTVYFKWHAAVYEQGGSGAIVRTITDKPPMERPAA